VCQQKPWEEKEKGRLNYFAFTDKQNASAYVAFFSTCYFCGPAFHKLWEG